MDLWNKIEAWVYRLMNTAQGVSNEPTPPPSIDLPDGDTPIRVQLCFVGRVQGVGFRFQAVTIARRVGLTGWVRNESDGSVLMQAQGLPAQIRTMVSALGKMPPIRIQRIDTQLLPLDTKEKSFHEVQ